MTPENPHKPVKLPQILLLDKTKGKTSYDAIRALKRRFPGEKFGHAGTLDPNATGLLIVGVGAGTKSLSSLLKLPKTYDAEILFGLRTDTGDITGKTIESCNTEHITRSMVEGAVEKLVGTHPYPIPAYSAAKQEGVPLYKKARRGEAVIPPIREMEVKNATLKEFALLDSVAINCDTILSGKYPVAKITFDVGSGTYIRSLAEALGKKLGVPATLSELRRTRIGEFRVEGAETI